MEHSQIPPLASWVWDSDFSVDFVFISDRQTGNLWSLVWLGSSLSAPLTDYAKGALPTKATSGCPIRSRRVLPACGDSSRALHGPWDLGRVYFAWELRKRGRMCFESQGKIPRAGKGRVTSRLGSKCKQIILKLNVPLDCDPQKPPHLGIFS